jgi:hypothetical protein
VNDLVIAIVFASNLTLFTVVALSAARRRWTR